MSDLSKIRTLAEQYIQMWVSNISGGCVDCNVLALLRSRKKQSKAEQKGASAGGEERERARLQDGMLIIC